MVNHAVLAQRVTDFTFWPTSRHAMLPAYGRVVAQVKCYHTSAMERLRTARKWEQLQHGRNGREADASASAWSSNSSPDLGA